jgi:hypothetical protein
VTTGKSIAIHSLIIAVLAIGLLWGNTLMRQRSQFSQGEAARARGEFPAAVAGYQSAIHMYTPGSPLIQRAAEQLWLLGTQQEQRGDRERALIAYQALRSSFYAIRGLTTPGRDWIARCDERIAALTREEHHEP